VFFAYTKSPLADQSDAGVARAIGWVLTDVLRALAGSVSLGLALALACAYLTRRLKALHGTPRAASHALELALLLGFALLAFTFSERCGVSGVMALFFCAVAMRHYTYYNLSKVAQHSASVLFTTLSEVSEASLAVLLGVAAVDYVVKGLQADDAPPAHTHGGIIQTFSIWDLPLLALGVPILLLARALNVFSISALANLGRPPHLRISLRMQVVMWFAGMRGAVSFALAITLPAATGHDAEAAWTVPIVTTTLGLILFLNLCWAPFTGPLIRLLDLQADDARRASFRAELPSTASSLSSLPIPSPQPPPPIAAAPSAAAAARHAAQADAPGSLRSEPLLAAPLADVEVGSSAASGGIGPPGGEGGGSPALTQPLQLGRSSTAKVQREARAPSAVHRAWRRLDQDVMKPLFGGRPDRGGGEVEEGEEAEEGPGRGPGYGSG